MHANPPREPPPPKGDDEERDRPSAGEAPAEDSAEGGAGDDDEVDADLDDEEAADARRPFELPEGFENDATAELVTRAKGGDAEALDDLFRRYHQVMVEMARRRLGPRLRLKEDPDDLAQTTFREATRDFANYQYRGEGSLLRWLIQILQNKIRDKAEFYSAGKRDLSRERGMEAGPGKDDGGSTPTWLEPPSQDLSVTMQVQRGENIGLLGQALGQLSPDHRQAITLVFFQGLSLRDAGQQMEGRSEDAVRMLLRRAEGRLRELLKTSLGKDLDPRGSGVEEEPDPSPDGPTERG